jgi:hypothetical protein
MSQTKVQTTGITDNAVTATQIADGAVGSDQIASDVSITGTLNGNASTVTNGVYTTNFAANFNSTGYQKFPGGFTIQWGTTGNMPDPTGGNDVAEQYQTFATPFTSAVFSVVATPAVNNPPPGDKKDHWACVDVSVNGFNMLSMMENRSNTYRWIAIGV